MAVALVVVVAAMVEVVVVSSHRAGVPPGALVPAVDAVVSGAASFATGTPSQDNANNKNPPRAADHARAKPTHRV